MIKYPPKRLIISLVNLRYWIWCGTQITKVHNGEMLSLIDTRTRHHPIYNIDNSDILILCPASRMAQVLASTLSGKRLSRITLRLGKGPRGHKVSVPHPSLGLAQKHLYPGLGHTRTDPKRLEKQRSHGRQRRKAIKDLARPHSPGRARGRMFLVLAHTWIEATPSGRKQSHRKVVSGVRLRDLQASPLN